MTVEDQQPASLDSKNKLNAYFGGLETGATRHFSHPPTVCASPPPPPPNTTPKREEKIPTRPDPKITHLILTRIVTRKGKKKSQQAAAPSSGIEFQPRALARLLCIDIDQLKLEVEWVCVCVQSPKNFDVGKGRQFQNTHGKRAALLMINRVSSCFVAHTHSHK